MQIEAEKKKILIAIVNLKDGRNRFQTHLRQTQFQ